MLNSGQPDMLNLHNNIYSFGKNLSQNICFPLNKKYTFIIFKKKFFFPKGKNMVEFFSSAPIDSWNLTKDI